MHIVILARKPLQRIGIAHSAYLTVALVNLLTRPLNLRLGLANTLTTTETVNQTLITREQEDTKKDEQDNDVLVEY